MSLPDTFHNQHIILHVRLKGLLEDTYGNDYTQLSKKILNHFQTTSPQSIAIPVFTYSFLKSTIFSIYDSASEVGRFSEEIRIQCPAQSRTLEPVFSFIDTENSGLVTSDWNLDAFGPSSLFKFWDDENAIIVNINLPKLITTQLHYIETISNVPYRYNKQFTGTVTCAKQHSHKINYNYYVRDLDLNPKWDRSFIANILIKEKLLHNCIWHQMPMMWFRAKDVRLFLQDKIKHDPYFLLNQK